MLRELELLPIWRARVPAPTSLLAATIVEAVATPLVAEVAVEVVAEPVVEAVTPEVVELEVPVSIEFEQAPQALLPEVNEPLPEVAVELLVQTPWLLYCSQTEDAQSQQLLQNILRALQLPLEVVTLYQQQLVSAQAGGGYPSPAGHAGKSFVKAGSLAGSVFVAGEICGSGGLKKSGLARI
ncbi:conserved hypothetical protein [Ricinus communis]|uniref:Uncharacterized protein n=1 Tax=Ricinus communis TaxID=3988 RepID=B9T9V2_RICCO|nr:conserved hypothetical protein [Ricinus communis]